MFDFAGVVKSVGEFFSSLFDYFKTSKENQSETEVIQDKRDLEKACRYAENAISIAEKEAIFLKKKDKFGFGYFVKKFRRYK